MNTPNPGRNDKKQGFFVGKKGFTPGGKGFFSGLFISFQAGKGYPEMKRSVKI